MKRFVFAAAAVCVGVFAQDDASYQKLMKDLGRESGVIRKADPKTGPDVAASAEKIAVVYDQSKTFWAKRGNTEDAMKWSDEGKEAALELASAAKAGDAAKAGSAFAKMGGTCKGCHDMHRDKLPDGTYKIK